MQAAGIIVNRSFFTLQYPALIRVWHWLTFLLITASMVTVLFASTLFDIKRQGPPPANGKAFQMGQQQQQRNEQEGEEHRFDQSKVDPETRAVFKYRNKIWDAHKIIGFGLCFLFLTRVVIEVARRKGDRLITRIKEAVSIPVQSKGEQQDKKHYLVVKTSYLLFYALFLLMALTGLVMAFEHTPFLKFVERPAREVHQVGQYLIYAYFLFHLTGVIRADLTKQKGIVSAMINGGNHQTVTNQIV